MPQILLIGIIDEADISWALILCHGNNDDAGSCLLSIP